MRVGNILKAFWNSVRSFVHAHPICVSFVTGTTGIALLVFPIDEEFWSFVWNWISQGESNSGTIRNIGLVFAGLVALPLALWRSFVAQSQAGAAQRQAFTAQEGLANDRYQKGAEMLGSDVHSVRIGGIYALRSLVDDMPQVYGAPVKRLLCAFIRNPTKDSSFLFNDESPIAEVPLLRDDVKAALEAVTVRSVSDIEHEREARMMHDIVHSKLQKLVLLHGNFTHFNLSGADLSNSILANADFTNAFLAFVDLSGADISGAIFNQTIFNECNLSGARFTSVTVYLDQSTRNRGPRNLTQAQLDQAVADPDNPPILDGAIDAETGEQLVWRGSAPST